MLFHRVCFLNLNFSCQGLLDEDPQKPKTRSLVGDLSHIKLRSYYSAIKKNEIMPFAATWMDLETIILSQTEKDKYHMISLICGIKKNNTNPLICKTETDSQI